MFKLKESVHCMYHIHDHNPEPKITSGHQPISAQTIVWAGQTHMSLTILFVLSFEVKNIAICVTVGDENVMKL